MKYTVIAGYNFWFYYQEEGLTFQTYHEYEAEEDSLELATLEILDEDEAVIESKEFVPYGYPGQWTEGSVVYGIRYSVYEIEADRLTLDELTVNPFSIEYKDQRIWEEDTDADVLDVINL